MDVSHSALADLLEHAVMGGQVGRGHACRRILHRRPRGG
jgi:hypothetical protein